LIDGLLQSGVPANRIAFVSFTRKALTEAVDRACTKFELPKSQFPLFKTIHAMCFAALGIGKKDIIGKEHFRELGDWLGYAFDGTWDESEGVPVGSAVGDKLLFLDNLARITMRPLREIWEENYGDCSWSELEEFQEKYQEYKSKKFLMDFTDMLSAYIAMCDPSPAEYVFVDEAQDLSPLQWQVLKHAFANVKKTTIAGDDDQSIYKWSGADVRAFLGLEGDKRVLSQSYRLP
jgi:superfamily I DNA/RNA helicase